MLLVARFCFFLTGAADAPFALGVFLPLGLGAAAAAAVFPLAWLAALPFLAGAAPLALLAAPRIVNTR